MRAHILPHDTLARGELESLPLGLMRDGAITDFDVFVEVGGILVLYAPAPYRWTQGELDRLKADGQTDILFNRADRTKAEAFKKITAIPSVDETLPPAKRLQEITAIAAEFVKVLFEHELNAASLAKGKEIASALVRCVDEDPGCVAAFSKLAAHDQYTYYHSGRVAAYALAIAMKMGEDDHANLQSISLGCLLHDIGKSKIDLSVINKPGPLTAKEWEMMRQHPQLGVDILAAQRLPLVSMEIVLHHHERLDGKGYPHGLGRNEILPEVTIAAFADTFDALTTNRPHQSGRTKYEALDFIRFNLLDDFFTEPYRIMVELLGHKK